MLAVEARRTVRASPDRIFAHIGRADYLARYGAPLWMSAEPVEKRRSAHVVTLSGYFIGLPVESVLRITLHPPQAMEFKQVRGTLRMLNGSCLLRSAENGTEVRYRLEVDPGIPMISDEAARQFLIQFVERMLDRIKLAAERKTPPRRAVRPDAAASPGVEAEEEESEPALEGPVSAVTEEEGREETAPEEEPGAVETPPPAAQPEQASSTPGGTARTGPGRAGRRRRRRRHRGRATGSTGPESPPAR